MKELIEKISILAKSLLELCNNYVEKEKKQIEVETIDANKSVNSDKNNKINEIIEKSKELAKQRLRYIDEFGQVIIYAKCFNNAYEDIAINISKKANRSIFIEIDSENSNIVNVYVDNVKIFTFDNILNDENKIITDLKYVKLIKRLISKNVFIKDICDRNTTWSYINENEECKTEYDQIKYNQTLENKLLGFDVNNLIVNSKLLGLFKTFKNFIPESNTIEKNDKVITIKFIDSILNEKIIYGFNSNELMLPKNHFKKEDFDLLIDFLDYNLKIPTPYVYLEITNMDNGIYGTSNNLIRLKNGGEIILNLNPDMTDTDIFELEKIILDNAPISWITQLQYNKPKNKYRYFDELLTKFKSDTESPCVHVKESDCEKDDIQNINN